MGEALRGGGLLRLGGEYVCLDVFSKLSKMDRLEAVAELIRGLDVDESIAFVHLLDGRLTDSNKESKTDIEKFQEDTEDGNKLREMIDCKGSKAEFREIAENEGEGRHSKFLVNRLTLKAIARVKFVTDEIVLVNFPGCGYWPCRITRVLSKNWRKVEYLGGREIGKAHVKVIREYGEEVKNDLEKYIPKRKRQKNPMLKLAVKQINKKFNRARNLAMKTGDGKKRIGISDKKENTCKKDANEKNNNNRVLLPSASFSEGTSTNNSSTTENNNENSERKSNAKETSTKSNQRNLHHSR